MAPNDPVKFDIIEDHKENIQALPSGRSARKLAELFSQSPLQPQSTPNPLDTKDVNDSIRAEFEEELAAISESDDPLDIYDRYVRWTFDAYPSAQATPQSQLHTLLERATKAFVNSAQYKNDPRYLKLWVHYINFFSDAPREAFVFLSRHSIGETLALFYEEYAAWLESAGRWAQAEEVYKLGIEREARPTARLLRKFGEFEQRRAQQTDDADGPSSPALPVVRPALAAKVDPFSAAPRDPQAPRQPAGLGGQSSKPARPKMAIFSDADAEAAAPAMGSRGAGSKGWDTIGSLADRKKENVMEPKPWAGETLKAGGKKSSGPKLAVFRDPVSRIPSARHNQMLINIGLMYGGWAIMYFSLYRNSYRNHTSPSTITRCKSQ
jgi:checkpoint serine/threonine-protein kinase